MKNSESYSHSWREQHTLTFFSWYTVFSSLPGLSNGAPVVHVQSLRAGRHQKLLVFALNIVKLFQIPYCSLFLWIWFCDIKITNGKADASTVPSQTLIIKSYSFYMKMKIILLGTNIIDLILNLVLPAVFVYVS